MTSKDAWGQANNQRMLEEADAYLGVLWLPHDANNRRSVSVTNTHTPIQ